MVYAANIVTEAEMVFMAGELVDATGNTDAVHTFLQDYAEAYLSDLMKFELTAAAFTALNATTKVLISEWAARMAGCDLIKYNMAGYTSRIEAEDMINILYTRAMECIETIIMQDKKDFLSGGG